MITFGNNITIYGEPYFLELRSIKNAIFNANNIKIPNEYKNTARRSILLEWLHQNQQILIWFFSVFVCQKPRYMYMCL